MLQDRVNEQSILHIEKDETHILIDTVKYKISNGDNNALPV